MEQPSQGKNTEGYGKISLLFSYARRLSWFISACVALALFYFLKKFMYDVVRVNNDDMNDTYHKGDALLIQKKLNSFSYNDVVYIEYPVKNEENNYPLFFQRLIGLPGDSVEILQKKVIVNQIELPEPGACKYNYYVTSKAARFDSSFMLSNKLTEGGLISTEFDYSYSLTKDQAEYLKNNKQVKQIELKSEKTATYDGACFPACTHFCWNRDNYGKLYIPRKNDVLKLDTMNINLYESLITDYENNTLEIRQDSIFINSQLIDKYIVKYNYYFVLGDNRDNANDSRVWGYLPEKKIKGKVIGTLKQFKK